MSLRKKETEEQRLTRCKEQYGCDGQCYNQTDADGNFIGMCGAIDICDETRKSEFLGLVFAFVFMLLIGIGSMVGLVYLIYCW